MALSLSTKRGNPMISDKVIQALNYRINQEELSSRLYLAMSLWLNNNGFVGASKRWRKDSNDELEHAEWAREYLLSLGIQPATKPLVQVKESYSSFEEIVVLSFDHEVEVTRQCKDLAQLAQKEGDHLLYTLAMKYLSEQVEEHDKLQTILDKLDAFGNNGAALRLLDNELGQD